MANETVTTEKSVAGKSRVAITNMGGMIARLNGAPSYDSTNDETTITLDDLSPLNNTGQYTSTEPGMMVIVAGQSSSDEGKTSDIIGITSPDITVEGDQTGALGDDDLIAIVPPLSSEVETQGGHNLGPTMNKDEEMGLTEEVLSHNSLLSYDVDGSVPLFATIDSVSVGRLLLAGIGSHKVSSSLHTYRPPVADDGTFTVNDDLTLYSKEADAVAKEVFLNLVATQTVINVPRRAVATIEQTYQGAEAIREVGGTGKNFPSGTDNWERDNLPSDAGKRFAARGALVELGGSYGNSLDKSAVDQYFQELTITIQRSATDVGPLGKDSRAKGRAHDHMIQVEGTRVFEDNTIHNDYWGGGAAPGAQTEDRMLIKIVNPNDESKYLKFDIPRGVYTIQDINRQDPQFEESFTFQGITTLDSDNQPSTSTPLYEAEFENGDTTDYANSVT